MLINFFAITIIFITSIGGLYSKKDVVLHYTTKSMWIEGYLIEELGNIIVVEWDVTKNGHNDLVITCENCVMRDPRVPHYFTIYAHNSNNSYLRLKRGFVFPMDLLLIEDEQGIMRLATTGPSSRNSNVFPILAVEQQGDSRWEMEIILWMNSETTEEEMAWLEEGRQAVQSITTIYSKEDIAEMKARRNADAATHISPQSLHPLESDNATTPALETLPHGNAIKDMVPLDDAPSDDELAGFIDGEERDDYRADTCFWIFVLGMALLFLVGLSAINMLCRRKRTTVANDKVNSR